MLSNRAPRPLVQGLGPPLIPATVHCVSLVVPLCGHARGLASHTEPQQPQVGTVVQVLARAESYCPQLAQDQGVLGMALGQ